MNMDKYTAFCAFEKGLDKKQLHHQIQNSFLLPQIQKYKDIIPLIKTYSQMEHQEKSIDPIRPPPAKGETQTATGSHDPKNWKRPTKESNYQIVGPELPPLIAAISHMPSLQGSRLQETTSACQDRPRATQPKIVMWLP